MRSNPTNATLAWRIKPVIHALALAPFALLVYRLLGGTLGFNPVEDLTRETGIWSLRFLLLCLAITPLRTLTGLYWLTRLRRMLGLYAFFYGLCHFVVYFLWDQSLDLARVLDDILERPYITVGAAALGLMVPLAVTSTRALRRRLRRHWNRLHRLIYPIGGLVLLHYFWLTRADYREPAVYAVIFVLLLGLRLGSMSRRRSWAPTKRQRRRNRVVGDESE